MTSSIKFVEFGEFSLMNGFLDENFKTSNNFHLQIEKSNGISIQCFLDHDLTNQIQGLCLFIQVMPIQWTLQFKVVIGHFSTTYHQRIYDHSLLTSSPLPSTIKKEEFFSLFLLKIFICILFVLFLILTFVRARWKGVLTNYGQRK